MSSSSRNNRKIDDGEEARIVSMLRDGHKYSEVAERFRMGKRTIRLIATRHGLSRRDADRHREKELMTDEEMATIRRYREAGETWATIAARFGYTQTSNFRMHVRRKEAAEERAKST